ncbi:hypothetical protein VNI00_010836 [Paramarasmius palmivorus]|uniref:Nephrocystin 3-like N-terminal domain-containing protein n=1 Tax=Paramarasmius palmivorus TaxID=297713 RepID=A0AAW0CDB8_9AGAR
MPKVESSKCIANHRVLAPGSSRTGADDRRLLRPSDESGSHHQPTGSTHQYSDHPPSDNAFRYFSCTDLSTNHLFPDPSYYNQPTDRNQQYSHSVFSDAYSLSPSTNFTMHRSLPPPSYHPVPHQQTDPIPQPNFNHVTPSSLSHARTMYHASPASPQPGDHSDTNQPAEISQQHSAGSNQPDVQRYLSYPNPNPNPITPSSLSHAYPQPSDQSGTNHPAEISQQYSAGPNQLAVKRYSSYPNPNPIIPAPALPAFATYHSYSEWSNRSDTNPPADHSQGYSADSNQPTVHRYSNPNPNPNPIIPAPTSPAFAMHHPYPHTSDHSLADTDQTTDFSQEYPFYTNVDDATSSSSLIAVTKHFPSNHSHPDSHPSRHSYHDFVNTSPPSSSTYAPDNGMSTTHLPQALVSNSGNISIHQGQLNNVSGDQTNWNYTVYPNDPMQMLWNEIASVGAMYNSSARYPQPRCHEDTRKEIQASILNWARSEDPTTERLLWLSGPAGAGKSAIAQTIAEKTDPEGMLVSSFFFWRDDPQRNNPSRLFLVIAYDLACKFPQFRGRLEQVIKQTPSVLKASHNVQLEKLILEPWSMLSHTECGGLIVIDALDECSTGREQQEVLHLIASFLSKYHKPLPRILLCSRPEPSIRETLDHKDFCLPVRRLSLDNNSETRNDIKCFLRDGFSQIRESPRCKDFDFPIPWPSDSDIDSLAWNACGQFIYAQTVLRFVEDEYYNPCEQLKWILGECRDAEASSLFEPLDILYRQILSTCPRRKQLLDVLGAIIYGWFLASEHLPSCTSTTIEIFYGLPRGDVVSTLRGMHSVIDVCKDGTFRIYHKSFRDFLEDKCRSHEYFIDENVYCDNFFVPRALQLVADFVKKGFHPSSFDKFAEDDIDFVLPVTGHIIEELYGTNTDPKNNPLLEHISHYAASISPTDYFDFLIKASIWIDYIGPFWELPLLFQKQSSIHSFAQQWNIPWLTLQVRAESSLSCQTINDFSMLLSLLTMDIVQDSEAFGLYPPLMSNLQVVGVIEGYNCPCKNRFSPSHLCVDGDYSVSFGPGIMVWLTRFVKEGVPHDYLVLAGIGMEWLRVQEETSPLIQDINYHMKKVSPHPQEFTTGDCNAYSARLLKCYMALFDRLDQYSVGQFPKWWDWAEAAETLKSAAHLCGAELGILKAFVWCLDICRIDEMDWCLEWLESFPPVHASKTKEAISKYNALKKRIAPLLSTKNDWKAGRLSKSDLRRMLFGELAPDIDSSILQGLNSKV